MKTVRYRKRLALIMWKRNKMQVLRRDLKSFQEASPVTVNIYCSTLIMRVRKFLRSVFIIRS